ncbi:hypothetical protein CCICO_02345 [Corynebacterium ciconiae DSM 44920]|uniref:hypothetical protein n=1 Tax=Corynebacterium ciconiae TaxID=227319 RepID=UPI00037CD540|nr:hypothetical protein [Corynebacterium ciconiae]WKD60520.1 hypothetical protein CCICO_02345 [Corynebacterium ciconiae DSM 44920]
MLRVLHEIADPAAHGIDAEALQAEITQLRQRVAGAELYRSLVPGETAFAVSILAVDEHSYSAVVRDTQNCPTYHQLLQAVGAEIYVAEPFAVDNGCWVSEEASTRGADSVIAWPGDAPVRIAIHNAVQDNPEMRALTAAEIADTRREPGCETYCWYENAELSNHLLLLELWSDQRIYDLHWFGRMVTAAYRGDSGRQPAEMQRGTPSREFYRYHHFDYHYGRLLPRRAEHNSHTVRWTAR